MKKKEFESQYRTLIRKEIAKNHSYDEQYLFLLSNAGSIALESCYTDAERGARIKALFQVWEEEHK